MQQGRPPSKAPAISRSNAGQWICLNILPLKLPPLTRSTLIENKAITAIKVQFAFRKRRKKEKRYKTAEAHQLGIGFIIHFIVLKRLKMLSLVRVIVATCV